MIDYEALDTIIYDWLIPLSRITFVGTCYEDRCHITDQLFAEYKGWV